MLRDVTALKDILMLDARGRMIHLTLQHHRRLGRTRRGPDAADARLLVQAAAPEPGLEAGMTFM
jgi:hypothetical protein